MAKTDNRFRNKMCVLKQNIRYFFFLLRLLLFTDIFSMLRNLKAKFIF